MSMPMSSPNSLLNTSWTSVSLDLCHHFHKMKTKAWRDDDGDDDEMSWSHLLFGLWVVQNPEKCCKVYEQFSFLYWETGIEMEAITLPCIYVV